MRIKWPILMATIGMMLAGNSQAQISEIFSLTNLNQAIPDGSGSGLSVTTNIASQLGFLSAVRVRLKVAGEFNGDLYAYLRHRGPEGTNLCLLLNRPGRTAANPSGYSDQGLDVRFRDDAPADIHLYRSATNLPAGAPVTGIWQPDGRKTDPFTVLESSARGTSLALFNGLDGSGEWTLFVADLESGGTNLLESWELELVGAGTSPIQWSTPGDIVYGTTIGPAQLNAMSPIAGTFAYQPSTGARLNAGSNQTLTVVFTPADLGMYLPATNQVRLNVLKQDLTVTAVSKSKVYGAALPELALSYDGFVAGENTNQLTSQLAVSTAATATSPVGGYGIEVTGGFSANYNLVRVNGTLSVTPATLTVTAVNKTKVFGAPLPELTAIYTGFIGGDGTNQLSQPVVLSTAATSSSPVGSHDILVTGGASLNYDLARANGTLTITPAAVTGTLTVSPTPAQPGGTVNITLCVNPIAPGAGNPSGVVQFKLNGTNAGQATLTGGCARLSRSDLTLGTYQVRAEYAGDGNFTGTSNTLAGSLVINTPPIAGADLITRSSTNSTKVSIASLLANDSAGDANDALSLVSVASTSAHGAGVTVNNGWVFYTALAGDTNTDSFTYVITDLLGGTNTGTVTVNPAPNTIPVMNMAMANQGNGNFWLRFDGIPQAVYTIEVSTNLAAPDWTPLITTNADAFGAFGIVVTNVPPQRYYRSLYK